MNLVSNPSSVNEKSLVAVSAPGQVVSPSLLDNIRIMNSNAQANTIATLSQNIAVTRVVNEALLSINVLQMGSQVPNIHSVGEAQKVITASIGMLQGDINRIMYSINIRRQLNSNVMGKILDYSKQQNLMAASIPVVGKSRVVLENGGIKKSEVDE